MLKNILVSTDGSVHAKKAEALAVDIASKYGAGLVILSVIEEGALSEDARRLAQQKGIDIREVLANRDLVMAAPESQPAVLHAEYTMATARVQAELAEAVIAEAQEHAASHGVDRVRCLTEDGDPAAVILDVADNEKADLIVMGSRGLGALKSLMVGSVSQKVSHLAPCSCITVK